MSIQSERPAHLWLRVNIASNGLSSHPKKSFTVPGMVLERVYTRKSRTWKGNFSKNEIIQNLPMLETFDSNINYV